MIQCFLMKRHNLAFIDVETTGFDPETQEIIELGVVIARPTGDDAMDYEIVDEIDLKIKPEHIETADPQALRGLRPLPRPRRQSSGRISALAARSSEPALGNLRYPVL